MCAMSPRLLRPIAGGFNPKQIANLAGWWDASNTSSLAQLNDGTTAVSSDSDPVGYWADLSGSGRNLTQSVNNNRPAYKPGALNGKAVIDFDGSNDSLLASFTLSQPMTYFLVYRFDETITSGNPRVFDGATGNTMSFFGGTSSTLMGLFAGSSSDPLISMNQRTQFSITEIQANGASTAIKLNGSNVSFATTNNIGASAPNGLRLGAFSQSTAFGNVSFAEVIVYSAIIAQSDANRVRSYLGRKYGITVS
jgi:hypothetical protein